MKNCIVLAAVSLFSFNAFAQDAHNTPVQAKGFHQTVLNSHPIQLDSSQHQMRALRFVVEPNGTLASHQHTGPGFICVLNGVLNSAVAADNVEIKAGQCVFDPGNENHTLRNATEMYVSGLTFEVIPVSDVSKTSRMHVDPGMESVTPPK